MPKVIRLDNLSDKPVVIGASKGKNPVLSEEEKLARIRSQRDSLLAEIDRLKKEAASIRNTAQQNAQEQISAASKKSETILKNASDSMQRARKEAEEIKEKARKEGYEDGYSEGRKQGEEQGYEAGYEKVREIIENADKLIETLQSSRDQLFLSLKDEIAELIISYVHRIIKLELTVNPEIIMANIKDALSKISSKENITIILSDEDFELVQSHTEELKKLMRGIKNIKFLREPFVRRGGCEIETDYGSINATIEGQFHEMQKNIYRMIDKKQFPEKKEF